MKEALDIAATGLTTTGALTGIFTDNGFSSLRRINDFALAGNPGAIFGQHDVVTPTFTPTPPGLVDQPSLTFAGYEHHMIPNFTTVQIGLAAVDAAVILLPLVYFGIIPMIREFRENRRQAALRDNFRVKR